MNKLRKLLPREDGQALFETALVLFPLLMMIIGIIAFAPLVYTRMAVDAASYDCVTAAVEAVSSESQGYYQGRTAAAQTVQGFHLWPSRTTVYIWTEGGSWGRGAQMVCQVSYDLQLGVPGVAAFFPANSNMTVNSQTALKVETYKSDWW